MYWIWCVWAELVNQSLHSPMTVPLGQTFMLLLSSLWKQCWCLACVVRVTWGRSAHIFSITLYRREILRWPVTECQNSVMWLVGQLVLTWTFAGKGIFPRLSRHPHALRFLFLSLISGLLNLHQTISYHRCHFQFFEATNWDLPDTSVFSLYNRLVNSHKIRTTLYSILST